MPYKTFSNLYSTCRMPEIVHQYGCILLEKNQGRVELQA
jgi:hypothetical protein